MLDYGYLMITFEKIVSTVASGSEYLDYMILRDSDGNKISPGVPSVLVQEKASKEKIILPNGNEIKNAMHPTYVNDPYDPVRVLFTEEVPEVPGYAPVKNTISVNVLYLFSFK